MNTIIILRYVKRTVVNPVALIALVIGAGTCQGSANNNRTFGSQTGCVNIMNPGPAPPR